MVLQLHDFDTLIFLARGGEGGTIAVPCPGSGLPGH